MKFLIYDTALNGPYTLMILQKYYSVNQSLFKGTKDEAIMDVSPWLFQIDDQLEKNLSNEIAIALQSVLLVESKKDMQSVCAHFKSFIYQTINGREYFFRFWDARVLKKFLPTCDKKQIAELFGPIDHFIIEADSQEESIKFSHVNGTLQQTKIPADPVFSKNQILMDN